MKRHVNFIYSVLTVAFIAFSAPLNAQDYVSTPVEISKEKVRIDGKICYSHVVLERQTLFSISKAYEVSVEDIYQFNPTLKETGLKKNSIIIIPSKDAIKTAKPIVEESSPADNAPTTDAIKAEEPEKVVKTDKKGKKAKRIHIAKWYEDLDVIAEQYGVSVEDIMKANNLKGRKLGKRQKLVIPYPGETAVAKPAETVQETIAGIQENITAPADTTISETPEPAVFQPKSKVDATIVLPLTNTEGEPNRNNMDFYSGALLAVYDMAQEGIDCNLNVFDIMDSKTQFSQETIEDSDVVIGPVSAADLTKFFFAVPDAGAVVSPLDPRAERLTKEHSALIQAPTPHMVQYKDLVSWMEEEFMEGDRVVMISEKGARTSGITSQMKEVLDSSALAYNQFSYSILEGRDVTEPLTALMTTEGANRILIASESEAFVNDVVRNLNLLIYNNLDIVLYAPSKIRSFETIEVENMHKTSMHVTLTYFIDYEQPQVKDFLKKYRALYNTEPTQFAFQGYDLMKYFIGLSSKYGKEWKNKLEESPQKMLQSTFSFVRSESGAFVNNGVRRIVYDKGYEIRQVK